MVISLKLILKNDNSRKSIEGKGKSGVMGTVKSLLERSREFEEAHCSCRELMEDQLQTIENYTKKWLLIGLATIFLTQVISFIFFCYRFVELEKRVDYRYFLTKESLENINKVKIEEGKVIWRDN